MLGTAAYVAFNNGVVDRDTTDTETLFAYLAADLDLFSYSYFDTARYDLVNYEVVYKIAEQINAISSMTQSELDQLFNDLDVAGVSKAVLMELYSKSAEEAAYWIDGIDIQGAYDLAW